MYPQITQMNGRLVLAWLLVVSNSPKSSPLRLHDELEARGGGIASRITQSLLKACGTRTPLAGGFCDVI